MTFNLRTNLAGLFILIFTLPVFATNIAIIESQSFHPLQIMDTSWKEIAENMGHQADILPQSTLDAIGNLDAYDVLIISSGLITTSQNQQSTIEAFVQSGRNTYIQSEYDIAHSGNVTFAQIVNNNGGNFQWLGGISGSVAPITVLAPFNEGVGSVDQLFYFWHGTYGSGDATITPFLEGQDKYWGFVFNSPNPDHGITITTSDQDWIRVRHSDELMGNMLMQLVFEPVIVTPTVFIDQTATPDCAGEDFQFAAIITDSIPELTLQWQINGQPVTDANQTTFTINNLLDSDVVECLLTLNNNNQNYQHLSNPILIAPVAPLSQVSVNIAASEVLSCAGEIITLTANGENWGDQPQFSWSVNGTAVADQNNATFSTSAASQNITCSVISNADCVETNVVLSNTITIDTITTTEPTISISANNTEICTGSTVDFSATGDHWNLTTSIVWFVDGISVNDQPTFSTNTLTEGQPVMAVLTQTDECGNMQSIATENITIDIVTQVTPTIAISANTDEACPGEAIVYSATGNNWGNAPQLKWMVNGVEIITTGSPEFVYGQSPTTQVISCELISDEPCASENNILSNNVTVATFSTETATFAIEADNAFICNGNVVNFRAVGDNWGDSPVFEWRLNGTVVNTSSAFYAAANLQTGDQVSCQLTTDKPCLGVNTLTSNVVDIETSNFQLELLENVNATCGENNGIIEFAVVGGLAPYTIQWNNGLTENFSANLTPGNYEIFAIDASGCTAELDVTVAGRLAPEIENLGVTDATCAGSFGTASVEMADTSVAYTYRWVNEQNFILSDSTRLVNARAGNYTALISDPSGCTTKQDITITETVEIEAEILADTVITLGEKATLSLDIFANSPISIAWKDSTVLSCDDCFETSVLPTESSVYTAVITSQEGCQIEVSQQVKVNKTDQLHIPNAFSPNGDGINDYFTVFGGASYVQNIKSLQIFNRWGATVFSKNDMDINDEAQGWNGRAGSVDSDMGVYIYVAEVEFIDGTKKVVTGDVSLIK